MRGKKVKTPIGEINSPFTVHEGLFSNVSEAKFAIRGVLRAYFGNDSDSEEDYLFFKSSVVRFEKNPEYDLEFDHRKRLIIFIVKEPTGEGAEALKAQIRHEIMMEYADRAAEGRGRTAMSIFRALDLTAKRMLLESEQERERAREKDDE